MRQGVRQKLQRQELVIRRYAPHTHFPSIMSRKSMLLSRCWYHNLPLFVIVVPVYPLSAALPIGPNALRADIFACKCALKVLTARRPSGYAQRKKLAAATTHGG
jgi:hypothetical protein